jgi:hypothetical protein
MASVNQQKKAAAASNRQQELQARQSQRQAFREAQIRRAQSTVSAMGSGAGFGSGIAGGVSSLGSQLGSQLGYSSQMSGLNKQIAMASQRAQNLAGISQFSFGLFNQATGGQGLRGLFPQQTQQA